MSFKDELKRLRKQDGLKQGELAAKLGVVRSTISMWENGQREPDLEMLEAIADYFNVPISRLIDKQATPNDIEASEQLGDFVRILRVLDPSERAQLQAFGQALVIAHEAQGNDPKSPKSSLP